MSDYSVKIKAFSELDTGELYELLRLRSAVFVVEQNCVYQDLDDLDYESRHIFIRRANGRMAAYARVFWKRNEVWTAQIGRMVSAKRGEGLGKAVLEAAIREAKRIGAKQAYITAQEYAIGFYEKAGFKVCGPVFMEDGIPHVEMRLALE